MTHPQDKGNEGLIAVIQQWIELRKLHGACGLAEDLLERALTALKEAQKENFIRFTAHGKACVIEVREIVGMLADCEDKAAKIEVVQMTRTDFEALPEFIGY